MKKLTYISLILAALLTMACLPNAIAQQQTGSCIYRDSNYTVGVGGFTDSRSPVQIPGANQLIVTRRATCLRITFSAEAMGGLNSGFVLLRPSVRNNNTGASLEAYPSKSVQFANPPNGAGADQRTAVFTVPRVNPGVYRIDMLYNSTNGDDVYIGAYHLSVDYRR